MKIKVKDTKGVILDWLAAQAEGLEIKIVGGYMYEKVLLDFEVDYTRYSPTCDRAIGAYLLDKFGVTCIYYGAQGKFESPWEAYAAPITNSWLDVHAGEGMGGSNMLEAGLRALAAYKLGEEVEVPDELCETKGEAK
jgi:hypothetical protein